MQPSTAVSNYIANLGNNAESRPQREEALYKTKTSHYGNFGSYFGGPSLISGNAPTVVKTSEDIPPSKPSEERQPSVQRSEGEKHPQTSSNEKPVDGRSRDGSQPRGASYSSNQGYTRTVNGRVSETVIEHPPIIRGVFERPSHVYTTISQPRQEGGYTVQGQPRSSVNFYVSERRIEREREVSADTREQRYSVAGEARALGKLREQNEELMSQIQRSENADKEQVNLLRRNIDSCNSRLTDMEEKLRRVTREKDDLTLKLDSKSDLVQSLRDKLEEVEQEARLLRGRVQKLESEKASVLSENSELESQVRRLTSELSSKNLANELAISELTNKLKASEDKTRHADRMVLDAEEEITKLVRELRDRGVYYQVTQDRSSTERVSMMKSKVVTIGETSDTEGLAAMEARMRSKASEINDLKARLDSAESAARSLESKLQEERDRSSREKKDLQAALEQLEAERRALQSKVAELSRKLEDSLGQLRDEKERSEAAGKQVISLKNRFKELENELESLGSEKNKLSQEKKKLESLMQDLQAESDRLKKSVDMKQSQISKLEEDLASKIDDLTAANRKNKDFDNQIEDYKYQLKGHERKIASQEEENQGEEISILNAEIERLQDLIRELSEQALAKEDELTSKVEELESIIKELEEANDKLVEQMAEYEAKNDEYEQEIEHLSDLSEKLACDNTTLQKKVDILTSQLEAALQSHEAENPDGDLSEKLAYQLRRLINFVSRLNQELREGQRDRASQPAT